MERTLSAVRIDPTLDPIWADLINRYPNDLFHSPTWLRILKETYGLDLSASVALDDYGNPEAGLVYCTINDIRGERIASLPFSDYCDPLVRSRDQWDELISPLLAHRLPISLRCVHNSIPLDDERFALPKRAKWHGLDVSADLDALWMGLDSSARRAVRKAENSGLRLHLGSDEGDVRDFFELHLGIRKYKYRLLAQPYRFFVNIWQHFRTTNDDALMLAKLDERAIGAVMYLKWGDTLYYKFSASSADSLEYRPTDFLIWEGIKHAKALGCRFVDFGLSDWDQDGLIRYKRKFASEEKTISFLHYASDRVASPQEQQVSALLPRLTDLLTDSTVPDQITEQGGDLLYRFFG